jgi:hypothetical protein
MALVGTVVATIGRGRDIDTTAALRAFGRFCVPKLAKRFPAFMAAHRHPKPFLHTLNELHYVELRKLYADAAPPRFEYDDPGESGLVMRYRSARGLCALVAGLVDGVADHYGVPIRHEQTRCMATGAALCEFHLTFATPEAAS